MSALKPAPHPFDKFVRDSLKQMRERVLASDDTPEDQRKDVIASIDEGLAKIPQSCPSGS